MLYNVKIKIKFVIFFSFLNYFTLFIRTYQAFFVHKGNKLVSVICFTLKWYFK